MNLARLAEIEAQLDAGVVPDIETIRELVARARYSFPITRAPVKAKPPPAGMSTAEREALCEALNQRKVVTQWRCYQKHTRGANFGVTGGSHAVHRDSDGNATYSTFRHDADANWPLGKFVGRGWVERLADAVLAKFIELNPVNCGWASGQRARTLDGHEFVVGNIVDHRGGTWLRWSTKAELPFISLYEKDSYESHSAADCSRIEEGTSV